MRDLLKWPALLNVGILFSLIDAFTFDLTLDVNVTENTKPKPPHIIFIIADDMVSKNLIRFKT